MSETSLDLEEVMEVALDVGVHVQMSGGYTSRVVDSTQSIATSLGAEDAHVWLASDTLGITVEHNGETRTSLRRFAGEGIDFTQLSELSRLVKDSDGKSADEIRSELRAISERTWRYPFAAIAIAMGVACGAFAGLFGASWLEIGFAALGAFVGFAFRHFLIKVGYLPFIYSVFAGFVSVFIVLGLAQLTNTQSDATITVAATASVLYMIPGVALLNGTADLITTHYLNAVSRLTRATVILLGITLGLAMASGFWALL